MDKQKIDRIAKQIGLISKISNLATETRYIDSGYRLNPCDGVLSKTGKLEILKLSSNSGLGPSFLARWDQLSEQVDIDMHDASQAEVQKFKRNKAEYSGHHTNRSTDPYNRRFGVLIKIPNRLIFDGTVSFSVTLETTTERGVKVIDELDAQVIRAKV